MKEVAPVHQKRTEKLPPSIPLSERVIEASLDASLSLEKGEPLPQEQVKAVTDAVVSEFTKDAPPLSAEQKKSVEKATIRLFSGKKKDAAPSIERGKVDIKEYQDTFQHVYRQYGLDKHAAKLGFLEGIMVLNAAMSKLSQPLVNKGITDTMMNAKTYKISEFGQENWKKMNNDRRAQFLRIAAKHTFPVWGPIAGVLSTTILDGAARKAYEKSTMFIRESINDRVANSVFMRDFEFIQDKSPAEILNIIDKGKQATMELINTTYTDIIPNIAAMTTAAGAGFSIDKLGGIIGLLRLPILFGTNKKLLEQYIGERAIELKQKDAVDTRIMTSLQSIEVVKASDTMENAISELGKTMQERDELSISSRKRDVSRRQQGNYWDLFFQWGLPAGIAGFQYKRLDAKNDAAAAMKAMSSFSGIAVAQAEAGRHATELVHRYAEKIQPALQDIKRMEELLGPYDLLDKPDGMQEKVRKPVDTLPNFDIRVQNLNFKNILHNVTLDIPQGSFVTIKGPSGIGKTTFLRHLVGFYGAEKGALQYGGNDLSAIKKFGEQSIYTKLAYANQNPQYFENMTLRENLLMWTKKQVDEQKLMDVLHDLHLDHITDRLDSKQKHFSGGELRRIGIARALLKDPKVLFLDEPTANLDAESSRQVLQIIRDMRKNRPDMTVIAVTHDPDFEAIAERIVNFADVNRPKDAQSESLGTRQVFYASADSASKQ